MHDVLRQRLLRHIESLPEEQIYQVLDYIEFLGSKYSRDLPSESTGLQRFAENLEDRLRKKAVSPTTLREAFQLIAAADRVLSSVSTAGRQIITDLGSLADADPGEAAASQREGAPPRAGRDERLEASGGGTRTGGRGGAGDRPGSGLPAGADRPSGRPRADQPPHTPPRRGGAAPDRDGGG